MRARAFLATFLGLGLLLAGCAAEEKLVMVKGKLTNGDKPFEVDSKTLLDVTFLPVVEKGKDFSTFPATVNREDMTFEVTGHKGKCIPLGKYRVIIFQRAATRGFGSPEITEMNKRFNRDNSPINVEVTEGMGPVVIDIGKAKKEG